MTIKTVITTSEPEGWGWPGASRKAHYFVGAMSLCRKWMYTGNLTSAHDTKYGKDDCVDCHRRLVKREAKA